MPPKQKQVKKGPTYKASTAFKDLLPSSIKELPRQSKPLKAPESFPETPKNNAVLHNPFEQWPIDEESVKSHDFGIASTTTFQDPFHQKIKACINNPNIVEWKRIHELQNLKDTVPNIGEDDWIKYNEKAETKSLKIIQVVQKQQISEEAEKKEIIVIQTYLRQESEEEIQRRMKEQAEKAQKAAKDKKKGKKQEPKQSGPLQVSDVKMANIAVRQGMCQQGIWIGSQLQIIKQRNLVDVYSGEPIWKKIYPQQNGVPQITKSGKYWVKQYYMGKEVKVQIDDRIPINFSLQEMFPVSENEHQKWTLILTKALVKLVATINSTDAIIGNGIIIYALTGMISESIPLRQFQQWQALQQYLNDSHYQNKNIVVSCYANDKRRSPSNYVRTPSEIKDFLLFENSNFKSKGMRKLSTQNMGINENSWNEKQYAQSEKYIESKIVDGYAYCIGNYFQNGSFNMVFSREKSSKQVKLRQQYIEMGKISLNNKGREEKLQHRRKKKQIKESLSVEEKKRFDLITKPPIEHHFIKILSDLKINCEFSQKQILLAKKCVQNKLSQPPNYDIPASTEKQKDQLKSMKSFSVIKNKQQPSEVSENLDDFSAIQNVIVLSERSQSGVWIKDEDFISSFEYVLVSYNPNALQHKSIQKVQCKRSSKFTYDENKEILVIEKMGGNEEQQAEQSDQKIKLFFGFSFQKSDWDTMNDPYCKLQKFDFDSFRVTSNIMTLDQSISSRMLTLKNQNSVFKIYTMSKGVYAYWISSSAPFRLMSIANYLEEFEGYKKSTLNIEFPSLEADSYLPLARIKLRQEDSQSNTVLIKLINCREELEESLTYRLVKIPKQGQMYTSEQNEGIILKSSERIFLAYEYTRITIESENDYFLLLDSYPKINVQQGSLEMLLLSKNESLQIAQSEEVEPTKFMEKYQPNKYGLIFRDRLFTNAATNSSFSIKIIQGEEVAGGNVDKKGSKKGGKDEPSVEIIQKALIEQRRIMVKITKNDEVIYETSGFNQVIIPNIAMAKSQEDCEYYLESSFDLRDWPEAKNQCQAVDKLYWTVRVMGEESVAFVRDTKQEEKQKATRKSWEDQEPGRAQRAKKSRRKFLLLMKKDNGEELTEEQQLILSAPRLTKKQQLQEQKKNEEKKGKGGKKDDKKSAKDPKKDEAIEEKAVQRTFPKSSQNYMNQIKNFVKTLQECELRYEKLPQMGQSIIRSQQELRSFRQEAQMVQENRVGRLIRNIERRQTLKIKQKQNKELFEIQFENIQKQFKQKWTQYQEWRSSDQQKDKLKEEKEKILIDIIKQEKQTVSETELKQQISDYREIKNHNPYLADVADLIGKNIKVLNVTEKITGFLTAWEVEELKVLVEVIKTDQIEGIEADIVKQMNEMLEQVEKNPNIVAQKQAEAKKGKKGGKK